MIVHQTGLPKLKIISDFRDYYDIWDDRNAPDAVPFQRRTTDGPDKWGQLCFLRASGYKTPLFDAIPMLYKRLSTKVHLGDKVVVITDPKAHSSEGKLLLSWEEAIKTYPECMGEEYVPRPEGSRALSIRRLQIGDRVFMQRFESDDSWRSNAGEVDIETLYEWPSGFHQTICLPLFAIDFVYGPDRSLLAVDMNVAPGMHRTGMEDRLPGEEVIAALGRGLQHLEHVAAEAVPTS